MSTKKTTLVFITRPILKLIDQRNLLLKKKEDSKKVAEYNKEISEMEAEDNRNQIIENFKKFSENPENINLSQMQKTLKKLWPKCGPTLPTANKNHRWKIVTGPNELKKFSAKEYKQRLRTPPIRPDFMENDNLKNPILEMKITLAQAHCSQDRNISDLERRQGT